MSATLSAARAGPRRLLRAAAAAAGLAVVAATSYAFLDSSGVTSTSITASTSAGVTITLAGTALPTTGSATAANIWATGGASAITSGMWSPQLDTPVSVTAPGDIAVINTSSLASGNVIINLDVTNTPALNGAYSYFNLPVNLYKWTYVSTGGNWTSLATLSDGTVLTATSPTMLSLTDASASWEVPAGGVYEIEIPFDSSNIGGDDGSLYMFQATQPSSANATTWSLAPDFYVSTQTVG